jgi:hypothetical protein
MDDDDDDDNEEEEIAVCHFRGGTITCDLDRAKKEWT